jgi:hypothetical protein
MARRSKNMQADGKRLFQFCDARVCSRLTETKGRDIAVHQSIVRLLLLFAQQLK